MGAPEIEHKYLKDRLKLPIGAEQIVDLLLRFSLFKRKSDDSLSIHQLVQETLKERYSKEGETEKAFSSAVRMLHHAFLDCIGGTDFLVDVDATVKSLKDKTGWSGKYLVQQCSANIIEANLEVRRWKTLSANALHLILHLLANSCLKHDYLLHEETARIFCEAAFYCYFLGMNSEGYRLQQQVFDILCAVKKSICFYKGDELMKVARVLRPRYDPSLLALKLTSPSEETTENFIGRTGVKIGTTQNSELLEGIEMIEPKAREAFSRGDYQASSDLYTEIVNLPVAVNQPCVRPLGTIFCNRGIANMQLKNVETALEDFNASIYADTELYRGYYWKTYALCKLVETGRTEFTSRAQAAAAVLHYKFANSKAGDIRKLQHKFQKVSGLLDRINYKFVTNVNQLKELESQLSEERNSNDSFTVIAAEGKFDLNKIVLSKGCYYFVCLPGSSAVLSFSEGLFLSDASFLFENVHFENSLPSANRDEPLSSEAAGSTVEREQLLSVTLGGSRLAGKEVSASSERELNALVEANDVKSLVMEHCSLKFSNRAGVLVRAHHRQQVIVSVSSSTIMMNRGPGIIIHRGTTDSHLSVCKSDVTRNIYGVIIDSPACFYMEKNNFTDNYQDGIVATGGCNGGLVKNLLLSNKRHAFLLRGSNAALEENVISHSFGWGILCCAGSNLTCTKTAFNNNCCGGLRIMLNGQGIVSVEKCEFRENLGPDVFPANAKEICPLEMNFKRLLTTAQNSSFVFYLCYFLRLKKSDKFHVVDEFRSPLLVDNKVLDVPHVFPYTQVGECSGCWTDLQSDGDWIECSSCLVARYCSKQCFHSGKAVHSFVCNSIREANKVCEPLRLLSNSPMKAGISLCVVAALSFPSVDEFDDGICLLSPGWNLCTVLRSQNVHAFTMMHGSPMQESMMDIKAASILAKFDPESHTVTVYWHRIFPVDKVPNGWNWVNRSLDFYGDYCTKGDTS